MKTYKHCGILALAVLRAPGTVDLWGSRRSVRLGFLTGLCALAGCNPPAPQTAARVAENPSLLPADLKPFSRFDGQARRLTTAELKSLFVGYYIKRGELYAPYPTLDFSEHFRKNGEYLLIDHGSSDTGTYDIRNDAVCVKLPRQTEICRHVFRDETGRLLIHNPKSSEKPIVISLFKEAE